MEMPVCQKALWWEEAAEVLGVDPVEMQKHNSCRVLMKFELVEICDRMGLPTAARERLEKVLPGERGRG